MLATWKKNTFLVAFSFLLNSPQNAFLNKHQCPDLFFFFWMGCSVTLSQHLFCSWTVYFASVNEERHLKLPAKGCVWERVSRAWYPATLYRDALFVEAAPQPEQHRRQFWRAHQPLPILSKEAKKSRSSYFLFRQNQPLKPTMKLIFILRTIKEESLQSISRGWAGNSGRDVSSGLPVMSPLTG